MLETSNALDTNKVLRIGPTRWGGLLPLFSPLSPPPPSPNVMRRGEGGGGGVFLQSPRRRTSLIFSRQALRIANSVAFFFNFFGFPAFFLFLPPFLSFFLRKRGKNTKGSFFFKIKKKRKKNQKSNGK